MTSNYKRIGDYIRLVDVRNKDLAVETLLGLSISKEFIPSVANTVGTNMANYKIIKKGQFACSLMQVRRDKKIPVALQSDFDEAIISQAYPVFEVVDSESLDSEYLMMWMSRSEFDRHACFLAVGGVRGSLEWDDFCDMKLPIPSIEKQRDIVREYNVVNDRISLNEKLTQKLEESTQAIYKQWFVDFEFPITKEYAESISKPGLEGKPYKSSGGEMKHSEELDKAMPTAWTIEPLKKLTDMKYGKMLSADKFLASGYPVFSGYGIRGFYNQFMYENSEILILCRGVSGTGKVVMSSPNSYITNLSIIAQISDCKFKKGFVYYFLKNNNLRSLDSGSAQSMITISDLEKVSVLCPCKELQGLFHNIFDFLVRYQRKVEEENQYLEKFKALLLGRMFDLG